MNAMIEAEDVAGLMFEVDVLCGDRDWDSLGYLAQRCRDALERGRQLWPIASHVDYRLALEAPAEHAAAVLERSARFTLGPLTEVVASTHTWAELAPFLPGSHVAAVVAQERILRGEDLRGEPVAAPAVFELPMTLAAGETGHRLPEYRPHDADFPDPTEPLAAVVVSAQEAAPATPRQPTVAAIRDLFEAWTADSDGTCSVAAAAGPPESAVAATGALVASDDLRLAQISPGAALVLLTWAGTSGGSHGRRRGGATGRFLAWWAAAALAHEEWPLAGVEVLDRVSWWWWEPLPRPSGFTSGIAVSDSAASTSTALWATCR